MGSILTSAYGIRFTYLMFSLLAGVTSLSYLITYRLFLRKIEEARLTLRSSLPSKTSYSSKVILFEEITIFDCRDFRIK